MSRGRTRRAEDGTRKGSKSAPIQVGAPPATQETLAIALGFGGLSHAEIADKMHISGSHLAMLFRRAAKKGYAIPPKGERRKPSGVPTSKLLAMRWALRRTGVTRPCDIYEALSERFGLDVATVRMRLLRHDKRDTEAA